MVVPLSLSSLTVPWHEHYSSSRVREHWANLRPFSWPTTSHSLSSIKPWCLWILQFNFRYSRLLTCSICHAFAPKMNLLRQYWNRLIICFAIFSPNMRSFSFTARIVKNRWRFAEVRKGWYGLSNLTCTDHGEAIPFMTATCIPLYRLWSQTNTAKWYDVATLVWYCKISLKEYIPATKTLTSSCILTIFDIDLDFVSLCFPIHAIDHTIAYHIPWHWMVARLTGTCVHGDAAFLRLPKCAGVCQAQKINPTFVVT